MINMFSTKALKPACVSSNISFPSSSKWMEKKTHEKKRKIERVLASQPPWWWLPKSTYIVKITRGQCTGD